MNKYLYLDELKYEWYKTNFKVVCEKIKCFSTKN